MARGPGERARVAGRRAGKPERSTTSQEDRVNQPAQQQPVPGVQSRMDPVPDCGEQSYRGSGKLTGKAALTSQKNAEMLVSIVCCHSSSLTSSTVSCVIW